MPENDISDVFDPENKTVFDFKITFWLRGVTTYFATAWCMGVTVDVSWDKREGKLAKIFTKLFGSRVPGLLYIFSLVTKSL